MNKKLNLPACLIMAGGRGLRLGSITKSKTKPLIKINNKPYLEYLLKFLIKSGFKKFYFSLSYKNNKIQKFLKLFFFKKNLRYKILIDKKRSGTFSACYDHISKLDKVFFYTNADEISKLNLKKIYLNFRLSKAKVMCGLLESKNGKFSIDNKELIIKLSSKKNQKAYIDCGFKFINKEIFKQVKKKYIKIEDFIYGDYLKKNRVNYFLVKKKPYRIDTALDIRRTKNELFKTK